MTIEKISITKLNAAEHNLRKDLKPGDSEYEKFRRSIGWVCRDDNMEQANRACCGRSPEA